MTDLIQNVIKRNKQDMERISLLLKSLDKLKSKEVAGRVQNLLIEEVIKLGNMNKQLTEYIIEEKSIKKELGGPQ
jgi:hypothetical protein